MCPPEPTPGAAPLTRAPSGRGRGAVSVGSAPGCMAGTGRIPACGWWPCAGGVLSKTLTLWTGVPPPSWPHQPAHLGLHRFGHVASSLPETPCDSPSVPTEIAPFWGWTYGVWERRLYSQISSQSPVFIAWRLWDLKQKIKKEKKKSNYLLNIYLVVGTEQKRMCVSVCKIHSIIWTIYIFIII